MRNVFAKAILEAARQDERVVLLSGDIGNRLFNAFQDEFPERFLNCGVAEANMTGVAAGLAMAGFKPFTYTITTFNTIRCLEQIKLDVCYHHNPVTIVGTGSGLSYAGLGVTHHSLEDIAFLRALPEMTVLCPADVWEVEACIDLALAHDGPVYLRLGKKGEPTIHTSKPALKIGRFFSVKDGNEVCFLSTGNMLEPALQAAAALEKRGHSCAVYSCASVKPLDQACLSRALNRFAVVATVEEHSVVGGFGSAVAEWAADHGPFKARLVRLGMPDEFLHEFLHQPEAREWGGLSPAQIASAVLQQFGKAETIVGF